ncbi:alpha/beta fold hydrolase [Flavobacterium sp. DG1-102-2]|uniref:alpha/beta hydrolase family protein n=1 Tax=Flavobacterium sp. DG1-102-2 TaxID=3081663 RepID=UPI0029497B4D|nr:alpha/beta fold hydrolase [Flavobacterium sp. DG1-102-2]MDV6169923.1 alpha/beta fold hydrolase [Flavobacterium sp. DG1-102-2]
MKKIILLFAVLFSIASFAQDIAGKWHGSLVVPGGKLRLVLNISQGLNGYTATMDSPDQGAKGVAIDKVDFTANTLTFSIASGGISYKGTYDNGIIKGTFTQGEYVLPLELSKNESHVAPALKRPQEPKAPFPYYTEEVSFKNTKAGITLGGTLTLPKKEGNYPIVILITGSGAQDRNEEIFSHKPFLVIADHLTRNGIGVLRYDDRGVGKSGGNPADATSEDFASDTQSAFDYIKTRKEANKKKIGLIGHSEGGMIAQMLAEKNADIAYIVTLAGPGIQGSELMVLQNYLVGKADGIPENELTTMGNTLRKAYNVILTENDEAARKTAVSEIFEKEFGPFFESKGVPKDDIGRVVLGQVEQVTSPWFVYFLRYNPAPVIQKIKCPVLALNGEKDIQVAAKANLDGIKRAAEKSGNKKVVTKSYPNLNHLFQEAVTGSIQEYETIEQTISPIVLKDITEWLTKQ